MTDTAIVLIKLLPHWRNGRTKSQFLVLERVNNGTEIKESFYCQIPPNSKANQKGKSYLLELGRKKAKYCHQEQQQEEEKEEEQEAQKGNFKHLAIPSFPLQQDPVVGKIAEAVALSHSVAVTCSDRSQSVEITPTHHYNQITPSTEPSHHHQCTEPG